jgi:hypothetical protein
MQILEHKTHLCCIKLRMLRTQLAFSPQISKQLSSRNVVHQEVEIPCVLGEAFESHQEGMVNVS